MTCAQTAGVYTAIVWPTKKALGQVVAGKANYLKAGDNLPRRQALGRKDGQERQGEDGIVRMPATSCL